MSSSLTIEVVEEGTSDLDFLTMTPNFSDFTSDILPSFSNSIDFSPNPSLLPSITNNFRQETNDNPPNAAYFPNPSSSSSQLLTKQQPMRRVSNNQSFDRKTFELNPPKNLSSLSHKKSDGVSNSVSSQFSPPTEGVNSVKLPSVATMQESQPQRSKLRRLRKPMNNSKKSSSPPTSLPAQNLSGINTNTGFDYSQRLKTPSVNSETCPLFPEYSNTSLVDQTTDEDDVFLKEEEITEYCSDRVSYSDSAFDSYQLDDMDSQDMFDSFTPIILHSDDPFMDDEQVSDAFLYPQMDMNGILIPPPLLMTQPNNPSSLMPHYLPPIQDKSIADMSKKSLRRASKNKSQKPILPSNLRNEVVPSLIKVESKETVQSIASNSSESTSHTSIPSRSKSQAILNSNAVQTHSKPKQPDNPNKQITFCDSGYDMSATKKPIPTPQIQFVSNTPKAPQGISKPCKMSTSSGWKFHNFDREKQPIRDSSGLTYHFYQPKSKIAATTQ